MHDRLFKRWVYFTTLYPSGGVDPPFLVQTPHTARRLIFNPTSTITIITTLTRTIAVGAISSHIIIIRSSRSIAHFVFRPFRYRSDPAYHIMRLNILYQCIPAVVVRPAQRVRCDCKHDAYYSDAISFLNGRKYIIFLLGVGLMEINCVKRLRVKNHREKVPSICSAPQVQSVFCIYFVIRIIIYLPIASLRYIGRSIFFSIERRSLLMQFVHDYVVYMNTVGYHDA